MSVSSSSDNFEYTVIDSKDGNIKCTSTKIENNDILLFNLIKTISDSGGSRFIKNSYYIQTSDDTSIFGSLSLTIIEIGWDSDNNIIDVLS